MMDWLKQNPFLGALAGFVALLTVGGGWLVLSEAARVQELQDSFDQKCSQISQLEGNNPFPDQQNVDAAKREEEQARVAIGELSKNLSVSVPELATPQAFQDELAKSMQEIAEKAKANDVTLSEKLFLGFEKYQNQIPREEAVSGLLMQLRSIAAVVSTLIASKVISVDSVTREPVGGESPEKADDKKDSAPSAAAAAEALHFPSFEVSFAANQPAFRLAFNRIMEIDPPLLAKKVGIKNSSTASPAKNTDSAETGVAPDQASAGNEEGLRIKPVLGAETLSVSLTLASVIPPKAAPSPPKP